jgi:osmoprotectant transport system ATP-binding protein
MIAWMVELKGVTKVYGSRVALNVPDLTIARNRVTALIGPSGCGKSTLLRLVLGLIDPDSGTVRVDGTQMTERSKIEIRQKVGYVVQDGGLFPHLTAGENVALMARYLGTPSEAVDKRVKELSQLTHIEPDMLRRYPGELSGGQRQRIGLMRALALDPALLLLDEPLGALDPLVRARLQTDLREIFEKRAKTVLFVTHDMGEAAYLADDIVLLRDGRIVQEGTLEQFQANPAEPFVTEFLSAQRQVGAIA